MKNLALILAITVSVSANITNYKIINGCYENNGKSYVALREFRKDNTIKVLAVNSNNLHSIVFNKDQLIKRECQSSRYSNLLNKSSSAPYPLENDGIVRTENGIVLTTDLCPSSKKGFEKRLYKTLFLNFTNPVPVTLFITKRWIKRHIKEFRKFKTWQKEGKLDITWGNHTAYHHYHPKAKLEHNYVLSPEENLKKDVLDLEIELLNRGVTPSVFFRFPGLVSNKKSVLLVKKLGLIIIGSNSWLANGDKLKNNSIILLHGNKNEPRGINMFFNLLKLRKVKRLKSIKNAL
jgi:peptidoglycan/xylan/chitin deacetylase (PgdA/CDA1 family)